MNLACAQWPSASYSIVKQSFVFHKNHNHESRTDSDSDVSDNNLSFLIRIWLLKTEVGRSTFVTKEKNP